MAEIAPNLLAMIPQIIINKRTVQGTLDIWCWVGDIKGPLSVTVLVEYLHLWEISENIHLQPDVQDQHIWKLLALATTLANLPIMNSFLGPLGSLHGRGFGSLGPLKVQDFHLV